MVSKKVDLSAEKRTISVMMHIYCSGHHHKGGEDLCDECRGLLEYAFLRLEKCKFGNEKPVCSKCTVHCYKPKMRERIREVMRYSGPRMAIRHPIMAIGHFFRSFRKTF